MSSSEAGVFSQPELEIERDYRKQVRKLYYKRESDFTSLRAYNDYLEEFESLVEQLIDKGTREAGHARLAALRPSDAADREARILLRLPVGPARREALLCERARARH